MLPPLVGIRFQVLFHSPPGVLFTFPSRYWSTIGRQGVFSLGRWSSRIPTGFHVSRGTRVPSPGSSNHFAYRALTFCGPPFQAGSAMIRIFDFPTRPRPRPAWSHDPGQKTLAGLQLTGLGSSHFARRYFGNRGCFLFLRVLRCFSSPRSPP